jgi:hypothetical protein
MDFMKNGKEEIHGTEGLKHSSWLAEKPIGQHNFVLEDPEMESQSKNPLYFEFHNLSSLSIPFKLGNVAKFYTTVFKSGEIRMKVSDMSQCPRHHSQFCAVDWRCYFPSEVCCYS